MELSVGTLALRRVQKFHLTCCGGFWGFRVKIKNHKVPVEVPHLAMKKPPSLGVVFLGRGVVFLGRVDGGLVIKSHTDIQATMRLAVV